MKIFLMMLIGLHLLGGAWAQTPETASYDPAVAEREQARINEARSRARAEFDREEAICYQRFAVNDCLKEVRKRRRTTLDALRREEIILNDQRRAHAAEQRRRRVEESAAQRASPREAAQQQQAEQAHEERVERARQKQSDAQQRKLSDLEQKDPSASPDRPVQTPAVDSADRAALQREYEEKVRRANERRLEHEQEKAQSGPRSGQPLPVPP